MYYIYIYIYVTVTVAEELKNEGAFGWSYHSAQSIYYYINIINLLINLLMVASWIELASSLIAIVRCFIAALIM